MFDHDDAAYDDEEDFLGQVREELRHPMADLTRGRVGVTVGRAEAGRIRLQVVLQGKGSSALPTAETTFPLTRKKERDGQVHLKDRTIADPCAPTHGWPRAAPLLRPPLACLPPGLVDQASGATAVAPLHAHSSGLSDSPRGPSATTMPWAAS